MLTLVARGLTNREIAAALVISVKTASVHVSHIRASSGLVGERRLGRRGMPLLAIPYGENRRGHPRRAV